MLQRRGLVLETRKRLGLRGQPATLLSLDPGGAFAIGIELGRRSLQQGVLIDFRGRVLLRSRRRELVYPMPEVALGMLREDIAVLAGGEPLLLGDAPGAVGRAERGRLGRRVVARLRVRGRGLRQRLASPAKAAADAATRTPLRIPPTHHLAVADIEKTGQPGGLRARMGD